MSVSGVLLAMIAAPAISFAAVALMHLLGGQTKQIEYSTQKVGVAFWGEVVLSLGLALQVWDHIFLEGPEPQHSKIPAQTLKAMRQEFNFWYPFDLRVSQIPIPVRPWDKSTSGTHLTV